jgi:D-alanyl-D-alanine dipeptidase
MGWTNVMEWEVSHGVDERVQYQELIQPIPSLDEKVVQMFAWIDKPWKQIPIKEQLSSRPKDLAVISNIPTSGKAMAWPAYYKNPRLAPDASWLGELAYMETWSLQLSPLVKARPEVAVRLDQAQRILDSNPETNHLQIVVVDGYRELWVQAALFATYRAYVQSQHPDSSTDEIDVLAQKMVSIPPKDLNILRKSPPPHSTWASMDLILADKRKIDINQDDWVKNAMIDFGSPFDEMMHPEFGDSRSETRFFVWTGTEAEKNRNILFNLMTKVWFTNYHTEWWHYDLWNQFWAASSWQDNAEYWFAGWADSEWRIIENRQHEEEAWRAYQQIMRGKLSSQAILATKSDFWI